MKKESCDGDVRKNNGVRKNGEVRKDGRVKNDGIDRGRGRAAAAEYFLKENEITHIRFRVDQVETVSVLDFFSFRVL